MSDRRIGQNIDSNWTAELFSILLEQEVRNVAYVPDAGHAHVIEMAGKHASMRTITLSTEEEGVAFAAGAWIGGARSVLLMQSSGVGNCINMLSLIQMCRVPFLTIITMRGEWGEVNSWQVPMGSATPEALKLMGLQVLRANEPNEVGKTARAAATMAYAGGTATALLLSQRLIGAKVF